MPQLKPSVEFKEVLKLAKLDELNLVGCKSENANSLTEILSLSNISNYQIVNLFIGPEGGFTEKEIEFVSSDKFRIFSLGPNILRTETAAIVSVGIIRCSQRIYPAQPLLEHSTRIRHWPPLSVTAEEMKVLDRKATEVYGIPPILLMENAGRKVAEEVKKIIEIKTKPDSNTQGIGKIAIFCGCGNNAGDGLVAARFLQNWGYQVKIILLKSPDELKGDTLLNYKITHKLNIPVEKFQPEISLIEFEIIVDALLGTGTKCEVSKEYRNAIEAINHASKTVIAVDIPSGIDADTGALLGAAVKATVTVTMGLPKSGLFVPKAKNFVGKLVVADIGMPI